MPNEFHKGHFIVLYGINNIGKSVQAKKLVDWFNKSGTPAEYIKYPVYDLKPYGPEINEQLRGPKGQTMPEERLQFLYALNRLQFEPTLAGKLDAGITVVAEDYTGTSFAWGNAKGVSLNYIMEMNRDLMREDLAILFHGKRFKTGTEERHIHENNPLLVEKSRKIHYCLAKKFGWKILDANQSEGRVFNDLLAIVKRELKI